MEPSLKLAAAVCGAVGFLIYLNSLGLGFCLDDSAAIVKNGDLRGNVSWADLLRHDFWGKDISDRESHKSYRPLTVATFRLNYMLHELQPLGYHLVNVLLHSAVCYLYVLLCGVVFSDVWPALIAGLLFAVHPIHTEAVSGVVGRADLLCALFTLTSLFLYQKSLQKGNKVEKQLWFLLCITAILCAALSKEIGLTAIGMCLAYNLTLHGRRRKLNAGGSTKTNAEQSGVLEIMRMLRSGLPRALFMAIFAVSFLWVRLKLNQTPPLFHMDNNPALGFPTPFRQLHWGYLCVLNVWLLLSPSQLCAEYAMGTVPPIASLSDPRNLLTLATFASLLSLSLFSLSSRDSHHRKLLFGLCLSTIPFLPASNLFFPVGFVIAERVLYIPSMGFCLLVSYGFHLITKNSKKIMKHASSLANCVLIFLILTQSIKTVSRNFDWKDNLSLFTSGLRVSKNSAKMWNFVGNTHFKAGNISLAEPYHRKALEVEPQFAPAHVSLVRILKREGRFEEAIVHAQLGSQQVVQGMNGKNPHYYQEDRKIFLELARLLLLHSDRFEEALKWSKNAAEQFPEWEHAYEIMGKVYIKLERYSSAKEVLEKALELKEDFSSAHSSLGQALRKLRDMSEAEKHLRRALSLNSSNQLLTKFGLVNTILENTASHTQERLTEALDIAFEVFELEPDNGNLTLAIAVLYRYLGMGESALEYIDRTFEINPLYATFCQDRGRTLYEMREYKQAEKMFSECDRIGQNTSQQFLFSRGTNYLALNETVKAYELLEKAFKMQPDDVSTKVNYGIALIRTKQFTEALEIMTQLSQQFPDNLSYSHQVLVLQSHIHSTQQQAAK